MYNSFKRLKLPSDSKVKAELENNVIRLLKDSEIRLRVGRILKLYSRSNRNMISYPLAPRMKCDILYWKGHKGNSVDRSLSPQGYRVWICSVQSEGWRMESNLGETQIYHNFFFYYCLLARKQYLGATYERVESWLSQKGKMKKVFQKHTSQQSDGYQGPKCIRNLNIKATVHLLEFCEIECEEEPLLSA
ncbi:hypothetical protein STEG23_010792 [Scotinomys teguina]